MRSKLILVLCATGIAGTAWADYQEVRNLDLETRGIDTLNIDAGAGSLEIAGVSGSDRIEVTATIQVPGRNEGKARKVIESGMVLSLERDGEVAMLKSYFDQSGWSWGDSPLIDLQVRLPENLRLVVDDGSGSLEIHGVHGDIALDDGSGSLTMIDVGGDVRIDDGSGSISVDGVGGDISINDGSGSIKVHGVAGSVTIDDGSGSIDVSDVEEDLIIVDDGSGGLQFSDIRGRIEKES